MKPEHINILRMAFFGVLVRPVLLIVLGFNVRHLDRLRAVGQAQLIAANHNSHLDALVLLSLFKLRQLKHVKVVAAKDYFCRTPFLTWFSMNIIGIIPIDRMGGGKDPLAPVMQALEEGYDVIIFPEGSRGDPEARKPLKFGVAKILQDKPDIHITPVFSYGLGKSLPRGECLLVPFICEVNVGEPLTWGGDRKALIAKLEQSFEILAAEMEPKVWL